MISCSEAKSEPEIPAELEPMTIEESYVERRKLFKNIWNTAMTVNANEDILNKPKVIKTLRMDQIDKCPVGKTRKQRIKNLRHVCHRILDFCDQQDLDETLVSDWCGVKDGVQKRATLSPPVFSVYVNDTAKHLRSAYHKATRKVRIMGYKYGSPLSAASKFNRIKQRVKKKGKTIINSPDCAVGNASVFSNRCGFKPTFYESDHLEQPSTGPAKRKLKSGKMKHKRDEKTNKLYDLPHEGTSTKRKVKKRAKGHVKKKAEGKKNLPLIISA